MCVLIYLTILLQDIVDFDEILCNNSGLMCCVYGKEWKSVCAKWRLNEYDGLRRRRKIYAQPPTKRINSTCYARHLCENVESFYLVEKLFE